MPPAAPKSLVVLHGDSELLKRRAVDRLVAERLADADLEYALEKLWAGDSPFETILSALGGFSLLAPERLVVVFEAQHLSNKEQKALAPHLANLADTTVVLTTSPPEGRFDRKPRLAADLLKVVDKSGEVRLVYTPKERELVPWVQQESQAHDKVISTPAASLLVEIVGASCDRLAPEVAKLALYVGAQPAIDEAAVSAIASPADDRGVFDLVDAIGQKNLPLALEIVRVLLPREARRGSALPLLGMIARHLRLLWQSVYLLKAGHRLDADLPPELVERLPSDTRITDAVKGRDFLVRKYATQARNFNENELARALVKVYEADLALKGFGDSDMEDRMVLETLVISLCRR